MPLKEYSLSDSLDSVSLYLEDLIWIEENLDSMGMRDYKKLTFKMENQLYAVDSVNELVSVLPSLGFSELSELDFNYDGFNLEFQSNLTHLFLHEINDISRGKYYQILNFIKLKQTKGNTQIFLVPRKSISRGIKEEFVSERLSESLIVKDKSPRFHDEIIIRDEKLPEWLTKPETDKPEFSGFITSTIDEFSKPLDIIPTVTRHFLFSDQVWIIIGVVAGVIAAIAGILALFLK